MPPIFYSFLDSFINPINKHKFDKHRESNDIYKNMALDFTELAI